MGPNLKGAFQYDVSKRGEGGGQYDGNGRECGASMAHG